jgi:hypothetical protein
MRILSGFLLPLVGCWGSSTLTAPEFVTKHHLELGKPLPSEFVPVGNEMCMPRFNGSCDITAVGASKPTDTAWAFRQVGSTKDAAGLKQEMVATWGEPTFRIELKDTDCTPLLDVLTFETVLKLTDMECMKSSNLIWSAVDGSLIWVVFAPKYPNMYWTAYMKQDSAPWLLLAKDEPAR